MEPMPTPLKPRRFSAWLSWPGLTGVVVILLGLALAIPGGWLIVAGGSWYYLLAGLTLMAVGVLLGLGRWEALWLYALLFLATALWAYWEVGLDGWQLVPRLLTPALLGVWLSLPWVVRPLHGAPRPAGPPEDDPLATHSVRPRPLTYRPWLGVGVYALVALAIVVLGYRVSAIRAVEGNPLVGGKPVTEPTPNPPVPEGGWQYYGRTADGDRFSSLSQIRPDNVNQLDLAWSYRTGDMPSDFENQNGREFNFEATPIKVNDTLYFCTPHRQVIALDATTGAVKWKYDPHNDTSANEYLACRGVAYYEKPAEAAPTPLAPTGNPMAAACPRRIIATTADARLMALDADTGQPCPDFGSNGYVSLTDAMGPVPPGFHFITSQPLVVNNRVILGGWIYDNQSKGEPSGVVRAYDPVSGALAWAWDMGRPDPTAPLTPGEVYTRGTPNGWGTYTADPALGLVYIPLGNATPDYYGADRRPFDDAYSSALVALDITTGQERWHFQTVHHDVWDFDLPIGPSLVEVSTPDGVVPALVQTTKMGELYLLDRRDGHPLARVEEKAVPGRGLPGERLSPTQPFSTGMPSLTPPPLRATDAWGATPIDQLLCRLDFQRRRYDGLYTPPTLDRGTIAYPAFDGVVDWHGASIDPSRHLLIANASYIPFTVDILPREEAVKKGMIKPWKGWSEPYPKPKDFSIGPQYGTPYAAVVQPWLGAFGAPCHAPPWGKLVAIDLQSRTIVWQRPLGTTRDTNLFNIRTNLPLPTGIFNIGGNLVTASGVIFIGATADQYLRAFDEHTGRELWKARLPAGGQANPMTYQGKDGRQYVVVAAGGHGGLRTRNGDYIMAYALPTPGASVVGMESHPGSH
ncbi:membrane-bound PQQ-dependent dehydrogenase, glucose/quinate/shikimate family [Nitrospirillum viridazoti CBAmc]|uniref:Membrane-bound PQQ-dependent dehydrogenase, glucose/quinate/shikimate family n=2 Tax=Nitrospirillum TaxID=1543705 RepID=A0A248K031_9PROT|nr:membrane-bound PQQ-dependent dehydrogenase, glucose/quinate/shikimate family [Nitrospirillum amazonense]ASG24325.1 membrane-bound PQQ-dependent dehydrogenase, glucose/quinate/shikimate family [Nitrospirillum amazonense CBAmc]